MRQSPPGITGEWRLSQYFWFLMLRLSCRRTAGSGAKLFKEPAFIRNGGADPGLLTSSCITETY